MANGKFDSKNVSAGKPYGTGVIYAAPLGTTIPTDAITALPAGFSNLGYVSEDGIVNSFETDTEEIKAMGGDTVLVVQTSRTETFKYTLIETMNEDALKQTFGAGNVSKGKVVHNGKDRGSWVYVIEILLTGDKVRRIVVPNAKVTEIGEITYADGEAIGYETTLSALPDEAGNTAYEYTAAITSGSSASSRS